jgi:chaperonin GroEL
VSKAISSLNLPGVSSRGILQNIGAKLFIDAAERTNEETGDGTTSCTLIAKTMLEEGIKYRTIATNIQEMRDGIKFAVKEIC